MSRIYKIKNDNDENFKGSKEEPKIFVNDSKDISPYFDDAFVSSGTITATCGYCGRTYFNSDDEGCFDTGELEGLLKKHEENPLKYIEVDYTITYFKGMHGDVIVGCKCGADKLIENWIWGRRNSIMDFLSKKIKSQFKDKKQELESSEKVLSLLKEKI